LSTLRCLRKQALLVFKVRKNFVFSNPLRCKATEATEATEARGAKLIFFWQIVVFLVF
jgi:hypothetical protein